MWEDGCTRATQELAIAVRHEEAARQEWKLARNRKAEHARCRADETKLERSLARRQEAQQEGDAAYLAAIQNYHRNSTDIPVVADIIVSYSSCIEHRRHIIEALDSSLSHLMDCAVQWERSCREKAESTSRIQFELTKARITNKLIDNDIKIEQARMDRAEAEHRMAQERFIQARLAAHLAQCAVSVEKTATRELPHFARPSVALLPKAVLAIIRSYAAAYELVDSFVGFHCTVDSPPRLIRDERHATAYACVGLLSDATDLRCIFSGGLAAVYICILNSGAAQRQLPCVWRYMCPDVRRADGVVTCDNCRCPIRLLDLLVATVRGGRWLPQLSDFVETVSEPDKQGLLRTACVVGNKQAFDELLLRVEKTSVAEMEWTAFWGHSDRLVHPIELDLARLRLGIPITQFSGELPSIWTSRLDKLLLAVCYAGYEWAVTRILDVIDAPCIDFGLVKAAIAGKCVPVIRRLLCCFGGLTDDQWSEAFYAANWNLEIRAVLLAHHPWSTWSMRQVWATQICRAVSNFAIDSLEQLLQAVPAGDCAAVRAILADLVPPNRISQIVDPRAVRMLLTRFRHPPSDNCGCDWGWHEFVRSLIENDDERALAVVLELNPEICRAALAISTSCAQKAETLEIFTCGVPSAGAPCIGTEDAMRIAVSLGDLESLRMACHDLLLAGDEDNDKVLCTALKRAVVRRHDHIVDFLWNEFGHCFCAIAKDLLISCRKAQYWHMVWLIEPKAVLAYSCNAFVASKHACRALEPL